IPIVAAIYLYAYYLSQESKLTISARAIPASIELQKKSREAIDEVLAIDPMEIELGYNLIGFIGSDNGTAIVKRIGLIRKQIAAELGIMVPAIRIHDNFQLNPNEYEIKIKSIKVASGILQINRLLAINPGNVTEKIPGEVIHEPAFGFLASW